MKEICKSHTDAARQENQAQRETKGKAEEKHQRRQWRTSLLSLLTPRNVFLYRLVEQGGQQEQRRWYTQTVNRKTKPTSGSAFKHRDTVSCFCWILSLVRIFTKGRRCTGEREAVVNGKVSDSAMETLPTPWGQAVLTALAGNSWPFLLL